MSFSFRNLFSEETSEKGGDSRQIVADKGGHGDHQGENFASPEAAYLASELLPFVPPAISAKSGIPMDKEVSLPLPLDGSRDVKLSTIYQICPELFAAEITPLNDSLVTLPPRIEGGNFDTEQPYEMEASATSFSQSGTMGESSPRSHTQDHGHGENGAPENPFWSAEGDGQTPANGSARHPAPKPEQVSGSNGQVPQEKPAGVPAPPLHPAQPAQNGSREQPAASLPNRPEVEDSGTANESSPRNPFTFQPATSTPSLQDEEQEFQEVEIRAEIPDAPTEAVQELEEPSQGHEPHEESGYATLFSQQAEEDEEIPSPEVSSEPFTGKPEMAEHSSQFQQPETSLPEERGNHGQQFVPDHVGQTTSETHAEPAQFGSGDTNESAGSEFSDAMQNDPVNGSASAHGVSGEQVQGNAPEPERSFFEELTEPVKETSHSAPPQKPQQQPAQSPLVPLARSRTEERPKQNEVPVAQAQPNVHEQETVHAAPAPVTQPLSVSAPAPVAEPESVPAPALAPTPVTESVSQAGSVSHPEPVSRSVETQMESAGNPGVVGQQAAPVSVNPTAPLRSAADQFRHLELKAVFGTSEDFTAQKVANLVCSLSGIASCAVFTRYKVARASRDGMPHHEEGGPEIAKSVRELARMNGIEDTSSFTLQTDTGMISLFLEGESCLSVRHESGQFEPGVREKLILVARSLDQLDA